MNLNLNISFRQNKDRSFVQKNQNKTTSVKLEKINFGQGINKPGFIETLQSTLKLTKFGKKELFSKPVSASFDGTCVFIPDFYSSVSDSINRLKNNTMVNDICNRLSEIYAKFLQGMHPEKVIVPVWDQERKFGVIHTYLAALNRSDIRPDEADILSRNISTITPKIRSSLFEKATIIDPSLNIFGKYTDDQFCYHNQSRISRLDFLSSFNSSTLHLKPNQPIIIGNLVDFISPEQLEKLQRIATPQRYNQETQLLLIFDAKSLKFRPVSANIGSKIDLNDPETIKDSILMQKMLDTDNNIYLKEFCSKKVALKTKCS